MWKISIAIAVLAIAVSMAYFLQMLEWNNELRLGFRPYALEKLQQYGLVGDVRGRGI